MAGSIEADEIFELSFPPEAHFQIVKKMEMQGLLHPLDISEDHYEGWEDIDCTLRVFAEIRELILQNKPGNSDRPTDPSKTQWTLLKRAKQKDGSFKYTPDTPGTEAGFSPLQLVRAGRAFEHPRQPGTWIVMSGAFDAQCCRCQDADH